MGNEFFATFKWSGAMRSAVASLCLLSLAACPKSTVTQDGGALDVGVDASVAEPDVPLVWDGGPRFTETQAGKVDLLIVTEEDVILQAALSAGIPWITRALVDAGIDIRVGVIGSDLGDPAGSACELPVVAGGALIGCETSSFDLFFDPSAMDWEQVTLEMLCRVPLSSSSVPNARECQLAQSFDALLAAMLPNGSGVELNTPATHGDGLNETFFRSDAYLVILMLTTPDDCSVEDPDLTTSDRYRGETALQRCIFNQNALRDVREVAEHLLLVRGSKTFGFYSVSNMPNELSGRPAEAILADARMTPGELFEEPVALSFASGWDPDGRISIVPARTVPSRRVVELSAALTALGVHTGTFSYQGVVTTTGQAAFEGAVAPLVGRMIDGLRQDR